MCDTSDVKHDHMSHAVARRRRRRRLRVLEVFFFFPLPFFFSLHSPGSWRLLGVFCVVITSFFPPPYQSLSLSLSLS